MTDFTNADSALHTRSYVVVAAENIRQIPGAVLDDDFIAGLFETMEIQCL